MSDKRDPQSRYYDMGGIETLDVIQAKLTPEQYQGYLLGNIIKYSCRLNHKGQFNRDLQKIGFYQQFLTATVPGTEEPQHTSLQKDAAGIVKAPGCCAEQCGR